MVRICFSFGSISELSGDERLGDIGGEDYG